MASHGGCWRTRSPISRTRPNPSPHLRQARERVGELRAQLNAAYSSQYALDTPSARGASATADELERLERELSRATRELQILMRGDGALDVTTLIDVERVQAALDDTTCLVEYVVLGDEIACFVLRREHFAVYRHIASRQDVERALSWFWFHIRKGTYGAEFLRSNQRSLARSVNQALQQLSDLLLTPIAGALATVQHLVVVPHGLLHGVPIHTLTYQDGILLEAATVSYAPSATVFAATAARPAPAIERPLIVAPEIADLPWVQEEARRIAEQLPERAGPGRRATPRWSGSGVRRRSATASTWRHTASSGPTTRRTRRWSWRMAGSAWASWRS